MVRRQLFALVLWLSTIIPPGIGLAAQGDITINFGGLCPEIVLLATAGPPYYLFPAGESFDCTSNGVTYFRIVDKVSNPTPAQRAQIVPAPQGGSNTDGSDDVLSFYNFKIYAVTPTSSSPMPLGYQITFWREHVAPKTTDGPGSTKPDRWYKTAATGSMKRVINNWFKVGPGYVTHPVGGAETALGTAKTYTVTTLTCPTGNSCGINLSTSGKWPETSNSSTWLTGNRVLRVPLSFKFQNGNATPTDANSDWILLDTGVKINDQDNADPDDQEECTGQYTRCHPNWGSIIGTVDSTDWTKRSLSSWKEDTSQSAKLDMFTKASWAPLQQDMARGGGEYLTSLATILEIPIEKQNDFFVLAQNEYRDQAEAGAVNRMELLSRLQASIAGRPMIVAGSRNSTP